MSVDYPALSQGSQWMVARVFFPASIYRHPPAGLVQLRVVRRGSSYADIDLGLGLGARRVFTRPGDLLFSLPDRPTLFGIDEGRELTLMQVVPALATDLLRQCGGALDDLTPLLRRPVREPLIAEILRRLEDDQPQTDEARRWAVGLVFAHLLGAARRIAATTTRPVLPTDAIGLLLKRIEASLTEAWPVDRMAEEVGLPRRVFAAGFKEAKGMTAHQYLLRMRADHAEMLLHTTDLPFVDVAVHSGFANQAHMTRVLNRLKRRTPGQIRFRS